jgi:uncharacterized protein involved in exopolysaccharide biosynthesis
MNRTRIICLWVVLGLITGCKDGSVLSTSAPQYTAQTLIKVLPYADKGPNAIGTSPIDKDIQYGFRVSMATLIKQQSTLQELIAGDKIQQTEWFKGFGKTKVECTRKAKRDLEKNFRVSAQKEGDYIELSMTCGDAEEAALIVNEMVDLFLRKQESTKKIEIAAKLKELANRQHSVQGDLNLAEKAMADVRKASGFTDLEEHSYPHPITVRLNRLELERDNCVLEIKEVQANIENLNKRVEQQVSEQVKNELQANLKDVQDELSVLQSKLEELEKMRQEAAAKKRDLDLARVQYEQRRRIRDERVRMLEAIKAHIEKLRIMHDDPETPKVQFVGYAPVPLERGSQK